MEIRTVQTKNHFKSVDQRQTDYTIKEAFLQLAKVIDPIVGECRLEMRCYFTDWEQSLGSPLDQVRYFVIDFNEISN